jgi:phosphatidylglycerophosphate synthase
VSREYGAARRPVAARASGWAVSLAGYLAARRVRPNAISVLSLVCAALAGAGLLVQTEMAPWPRALLLLLAAGLMELRLLANLLDGMVAIEGGLGTKGGPVFNELPDRFSDVIVLACAGYGTGLPVWGPALGWSTAVFAVLTAYVRALAGSLGARQDFGGPMAKQARMHVMVLACVMGALLVPLHLTGLSLLAGLAVTTVGCALTVAKRTLHLVNELEMR